MSTQTTSRCHRFGLGVALAALLALLALPVAAQDGGTKIGVVNLDYIVAESPAGKALQAKLETFQQQVQGQAEQQATAARDLRQRMADGANSLSEDKLAEMQKELEDITIAMRRFRDDKQREGQKMQNEGLREIEKQLEPVFQAVRDEGGYDLILNNVPGMVVMSSESVDITQKVLDKLATGAGG